MNLIKHQEELTDRCFISIDGTLGKERISTVIKVILRIKSACSFQFKSNIINKILLNMFFQIHTLSNMQIV